jgi:hypothetical protein
MLHGIAQDLHQLPTVSKEQPREEYHFMAVTEKEWPLTNAAIADTCSRANHRAMYSGPWLFFPPPAFAARGAQQSLFGIREWTRREGPIVRLPASDYEDIVSQHVNFKRKNVLFLCRLKFDLSNFPLSIFITIIMISSDQLISSMVLRRKRFFTEPI